MSQEWKEPAAADDVQMPLGVGGGGEDAPMEDYAASSKPRINSSTLALVAAFGAALVVLYFLGLQNKPRAASAEDQQHGQEIAARIKAWTDRASQQTTGAAGSEGERLLGVLQNTFNEKAVVPELVDNPWPSVVKAPPPPPPPPPGDNTPRPPVVEPEVDPLVVKELLAVAKEYENLKLQMIILGQPTAALINNQMVTVDHHFKYLTVTAIQSDRVILRYKDKQFELTVNGAKKP